MVGISLEVSDIDPDQLANIIDDINDNINLSLGTIGYSDFLTDKLVDYVLNNNKKTIAVDPNDLPKLEGYPIPEELRDPLPGYKPLDPDELGPNHTGHDGGLDDFDIRHDTGGNQIPDKDWRDNVYISENIQEKTVDSLIGTQGKNEISGSDIKRYAEDMKKNGFDKTKPIDVVIINGKVIIIDGHHRAAAAKLAGIKNIPVRINEVKSKEAADQILIWAAEAKNRY